jgi:nucleoid DNA-binding protein
MINPFYPEIVNEIAKELGQPPHVIERIVRHQFKFLMEQMSEGKYQNVRLHHLGVFGVKAGRLYKLGKNDPRKEE